MGTSSDAPSLDVIYKLSEIADSQGEFMPTMKLSKNKVTYPGRKQVFRIKDRANRFVKDILALEDEKAEGVPLLKQVVSGGKQVRGSELLKDIRARVGAELAGLPQRCKNNISSKKAYPVQISAKLETLTAQLSRKLAVRQTGHG
jgi:nicotinate phosphoribosyltransferase